MLPRFRREEWMHKLRRPDWYNQLEEELTRFIFPVVHDDPGLKEWRQEVYNLVGEMLERGEIPLATTGPDLDSQRRSIDTIIIHHTEDDAQMPLATLSAIGLLRQYSFQYLQDDVLGRPVRGEAVWSGHFRSGSMVFFAYHWLIYPNGMVERLLEDRAIGWHAGNWEINTRSIGLALAGNYEHAVPPVEQLVAAAHVIRRYYSSILPEQVLGHREVRTGLTCPGAFFLKDWKQTLLEMLDSKFDLEAARGSHIEQGLKLSGDGNSTAMI